MKIDATTILLIGAAAVAVYFITRPATPVQTLPVYNPYPGISPYASQPNTTAQDINAGGTAVSQVIKSLGDSGLF